MFPLPVQTVSDPYSTQWLKFQPTHMRHGASNLVHCYSTPGQEAGTMTPGIRHTSCGRFILQALVALAWLSAWPPGPPPPATPRAGAQGPPAPPAGPAPPAAAEGADPGPGGSSEHAGGGAQLPGGA